MKKVFVLDPSEPNSIKELKTLLNEGWSVVSATSVAVSVTSSSYARAEGDIVYILSK